MPSSRAVHTKNPHINSRGDGVERKYDATYRFPGSKTVVHVVAPLPMSEAEKEKVLHKFHLAAWAVWKSLPVEEQIKINLGVDLTKILQRRLHMLAKAE